MSTQEPRLPGNLAHLNRLIDAWSENEPESDADVHPVRRTTQWRRRRLVGVVAFAGMLDGLRDAHGNPRIGFKGGSALELRFGFGARSSSDLDAVFRGELDEAMRLIEVALESGWNGFTGTLGPAEEITRAQLPINPRRVKVKLRYKTKPFVSIAFEIGIAEGKSMDEPELVVVAVSLAPVQIPPLEDVVLLPLRYQIAQKLHACTEDVGDPPNARVHDLADLSLLERFAVEPEDLPDIKEACVETFQGRGNHAWPPEIIEWPGWRALWTSLAETEGLDETFDEVVARVNAFLLAIDSQPA